MTATWRIDVGDCRELLEGMDEGSVQTCVTSPPYFGLRDYGVDGQLGLEATPDEFVEAMVAVFREVRRVLRDDGTLWLNLGDSYSGGANSGTTNGPPPNPMPESVTDRPTKAHEYLFLLSKQSRYFYDADAIREEGAGRLDLGRMKQPDARLGEGGAWVKDGTLRDEVGRNKRDVWTVATQPFAGAHFATFLPKLIEPCVLAGAPEGGVVLDPFAGAGTTGLVALRHDRSFVGLELNPEYAEMARDRIRDDAPLLNTPSEVAA